LWERIQREATLPQSGVGVAFLLNAQVSPRAATLFGPLDEFMRRDPV
jgi:multiple sugar transport system substrate-binding protein